MILYHATLAAFPELLARMGDVDVLTSYVEGWVPDTGGRVFLDSGAFTTFSTGKQIDIGEYTLFCLEHGHRYTAIAGLDVIGNPTQSARNYEFMRRAGVEFLPTFHIGDSWEFFHRLIIEYPYIAIGGVAWRQRKGEAERKPILRALTYAHLQAKRVGVRLHGFGITRWEYIQMYPWHSVDSSTFNVGARFGHILILTGHGVSQSIRPGTYGVERETRRLKRELQKAPFDHPYTERDLIPEVWEEDTREHLLNRLHWNLLILEYANQHYT